ncbi:hypothetical protein K402DRAFT_423017 [Aulographum hederae CBS 113979]|uniref:Uncharacterized protein n=1 Tax=Aulographum hederae CBS 113979 TaxID=1176131 RepID=A0A6G1GTC1_9PEZI|nr:hypothetical protein K402DRAFT_423017 [Aulographum hederae CBS 113979]
MGSTIARTRPNAAPPTGLAETSKLARPAFSTFQQHYSPKKSSVVKPPSSSYFAPPSTAESTATAGDSLGADATRVQTELLQLHLLHEASGTVQKQWDASAKRSLRSKFDEVSARLQGVQAEERQARERINIAALHEWDVGPGFAENVHVLSSTLREVPGLVEDGGRFAKQVESFEGWISWIGDVWNKREENDGQEGLEFAEGLGEAWKAESDALTRKLASLKRDLEGLHCPIGDSSAASVIRSSRRLVDGMLAELRIMRSVEQEVVERERSWVDARLGALTAEMEQSMASSAKVTDSKVAIG